MTTDNGQPRIGFVGLGVMGRPMALNLVRAGFPVTVYDINPASVAALSDAGATAASNVTEAARNSDVFITMVVNDVQCRAVLFDSGAVEQLAPGSVVLGMSTMSRATVQTMAAQLAERNLVYLDAPVSGGEIGAQTGQLSIMVGGASEVLARCRPVLDALGANVYHVGPAAGDGQAVKIINQLMVAVHNVVAAEALHFGTQMGLDQAMLHDIISNSAGNSWIFGDRGRRMVAREFTSPKSAMHILAKDIGFVNEAANALGHPLLLGSLAQQLYKMALAQGMRDLDDSAMIMLMEQLSEQRDG